MAIDGCDAGLQALKALLCSGELQLPDPLHGIELAITARPNATEHPIR